MPEGIGYGPMAQSPNPQGTQEAAPQEGGVYELVEQVIGQLPPEQLMQIAQMQPAQAMDAIAKAIEQGGIEASVAADIAQVVYQKVLEKAQVAGNQTLGELNPGLGQQGNTQLQPTLAGR